MIHVRLRPEIEKRLNRIAKESGRSIASLAGELIEGNLEELGDQRLAEARLQKRSKTFTSVEIRKKLRLDD